MARKTQLWREGTGNAFYFISRFYNGNKFYNNLVRNTGKHQRTRDELRGW